MYLSSSKIFYYSKWSINKNNNEFLFKRICTSQKDNNFSAFIYKIEDDEENVFKYRCQVPGEFKIKNSRTKNLFIKQIKDFYELEQAVTWIDLFLIKKLKAEIEQPFTFMWYKEEGLKYG